MDERLTEFVRGLRAAGVRVSMAESADARRAISLIGIQNRDLFYESLRTTLVKEGRDFPIFDRLFPLYFSAGDPPVEEATADMTAEEIDKVQDAIGSFDQQAQQLLDWLTSGNPPSAEELEQLARELAQQRGNSPRKAQYITSQMFRELGFNQLEDTLLELIAKLQEMGVRPEAINALLGIAEENAESIRERIAQIVGLEVAREQAEQTGNGRAGNNQLRGENQEVLDRPFEFLSESDTELLRLEVRRLVQQLRSRAALRRKQGREGKFDAKSTIRANQKYDGVPIELKFRKQKLKPSLVFFVDVSGSMERIVEFLLRFIYQLSDQLSKVRIFTYYADLSELHPKVIELVGENMVTDAFYVIRQTHPYRPYATDLGHCLETFYHNYLSTIDNRSSVIFLGDGRNNFNPAREELVKGLQMRAKKLIWLNPEPISTWQRPSRDNDSDMAKYAPYCDALYTVGNLAQLSRAIDALI